MIARSMRSRRSVSAASTAVRNRSSSTGAKRTDLRGTLRLVEEGSEVIQLQVEPEAPAFRDPRAAIARGRSLNRGGPRVEERALGVDPTIAEATRPHREAPIAAQLGGEIEK